VSGCLQIGLLGGFRVEREGAELVCDWPRRSARTLTKLLATAPGHCLHREQVIDVLWPGVDLTSALNSFGKALHAARHALEPELPPRAASRYLHLGDGLLTLDRRHVVVDADRFQALGEQALRRGDVDGYEQALGAYAGELLPEDRYEDWCAGRRAALAELRLRLLLGLAGALERQGAHTDAAARLAEVVAEDPAREDAHRRLIRLWAQIGDRDRAVRQFHRCEEALRRELDLAPQAETVSLYRDVLANRVARRAAEDEAAPAGHEQVLQRLLTLTAALHEALEEARALRAVG
jgi:DNA-binding SARP family transcriptional activator